MIVKLLCALLVGYLVALLHSLSAIVAIIILGFCCISDLVSIAYM